MTRLLLIHTGGTISMVPGPKGFEPRAGVAEQLARTIVEEDLPEVALEIHAFDPLIDSASIGPGHWNRLVALIEESQPAHDGVVITHGTDTLAYTSAALSFALQGLDCSVVVTGAMRPITSEGSDAIDNLRSALKAAATGTPGVRVQFAGRLMAGDRVVKASSVALDAFREIPQATPAAASPLPDGSARRFAEARIAILSLSPGLTAEALEAMLAPLDGAVLRCYGSGTVPADPRIRAVLHDRIAQGLTVLAVSQCEHGGVRPGEYAAAAALRETGIIDGAALTAEAAYAKLALMLSEAKETPLRELAGAARC